MVASECMDALERNHNWQITCHCSRTGRPQTAFAAHPPRVTSDLTGYFPRGWTHHHALLPAARHLAGTPQIVASLEREARESDVTLLFNPRRLSTLQWLPAMRAARNPLVWVSDYWPAEYPDCDKLWQASRSERISYSPLIMAGAARVRKLYANHRPSSADLACIKRAAFVSEYILKKNAPFFPNLEEGAVIHNGIDPALFPFAPMTSERWRTWGFCGRIQREKGVVLALDLFARAAQTRPDLRFLLAGDMEATAHGAEIRRKIAAHPILSRQVTLLGKIPRERLAPDFYHKTGVLLFTSQWAEPFALTVVEAMSCGTYVVATATGGTPEIVNRHTGMLLPSQSPKNHDIHQYFQDQLPSPRQNEQLRNAHGAAAKQSLLNMACNLDKFARAREPFHKNDPWTKS